MAWTTPRTWVAGETVTAAIMNTHVRDNLTAAATTFIADSGAVVSSVTLSTTSAFASPATVTFTLTVQTRLRIDVNAQFQPATAVQGRYLCRAGYNSGASAVIGSVIPTGLSGSAQSQTAGGGGSVTTGGFGFPLLAAGQYTAYASLTRNSGGAATDVCQSSQVTVSTAGFV